LGYGIRIGELKDHGDRDFDKTIELLISDVDGPWRGIRGARLAWSHVKAVDQADNIARPSDFGRGGVIWSLNGGKCRDERGYSWEGSSEGRRFGGFLRWARNR
jgi:hypothetical protein